MKKLLFSFGLILIAVLSFNFTNPILLNNTTKVVGVWDYSVPNAPYEYQKGELTIENLGNELSGRLKVNNDEIELLDIILNKNTLSFNAYIEGTVVSFKLDFEKKSFAGNVSYTDGILSILGTKKQ
jgi:hypothetical protein